MGINPVKFGPYFWGSLHLACAGGIDPQALKLFVEMYPFVLPCGVCGRHFAEVLKESPLPETDDVEVLFRWSVDVHNMVNKKLEKPVVSYEEAKAVWLSLPEDPVAPPRPQFDFKIAIIACLVMIILVGYFILSKK
jgi:hypothetical protein